MTKFVWQAKEYHSHSSAQKDAAMELLRSVHFKGDEKILDIGCGDGKITANISRYVPSGFVLGIDNSLNMIHFAQETFPKNRYSNLTFLHQDAHQLNYTQEFDIIFSSFALQWVFNHGDFLKNAYRSLTPSGYLVATIPLGGSAALEQSLREILVIPEWTPYFTNFSQSWHFPNKNEFAQLLNLNEFVSIRVDEVLQEVVFSSRENFEKYVAQWLVYLHYLPEHLKEVFFKQVIDRYLEIEPFLDKGHVRFNFPRLDIVASKAIS